MLAWHHCARLGCDVTDTGSRQSTGVYVKCELHPAPVVDADLLLTGSVKQHWAYVNNLRLHSVPAQAQKLNDISYGSADACRWCC